MDSPELVTDEAAWRLATAYIDAWNRRDREAWLELLHEELEFHPTALVATGVVYRGIDGAAEYFDDLVAGNRAERAEVVGLRRIAPTRFLIELELWIEERHLADAQVIAEVLEGKFVDTRGYLSEVRTLASTGLIPEEAPAISRPELSSARYQ
jgi:hypothetical protein